MKKFVSFALAVMMIAAMAVTAFAAVDSISFEQDENGITLGQDQLLPGTTYRFPLLIARDGGLSTNLTPEDLEGHRLDISVTKGSGVITTPKAEEKDGKIYLTFTTSAHYSVKAAEAEIKVRYLSREPLKELASVTTAFSVGNGQISDDALAGLEKGDALEISPDAPVLSAAQLEAFAKLNDYKAVTFTGSGWSFTGKVNNMDGLNLYTTQAPIMEVVKKFDENQFKFLTFASKPRFADKGTLTIDVSDVEQKFDGKFFLYKYQDNRLYKLNFRYDEGAGTISFNPSDLGSYVITDREITDLMLNGSGSSSSGSSSSGSGNSSSASGSSSSGSSSSGSSSETNPETGITHPVSGAVVALLSVAVLSLAVTRKR